MLSDRLRLNAEEVFSSLSVRGSNAIEALLEHARAPAEYKQLPAMGIGDAAELIGYTSHHIRHLERRGDIPEPQKNEDGRRVYTLAEVNILRERLGKALKRPTKNTPVVAFANLKGGSAKTTTSVHFAQFAARLGLKVLLVDLDPQASATSMFGYLPDIHLKESETIGAALTDHPSRIREVIKATYWDRLDLIPSQLNVVGDEMELLQMPDNSTRLRDALDLINGEYDLVLLDSPPALGLLSINAIMAADYVVMPVIPNMVDISSSIQFFRILENLASRDLRLAKLSILITRFNNGPEHVRASTLLRSIYIDTVLTTQMIETAELAKAGNDAVSVYEIVEPRGSRETYRRAVSAFDAVNREILASIQSLWEQDANPAELAKRTPDKMPQRQAHE